MTIAGRPISLGVLLLLAGCSSSDGVGPAQLKAERDSVNLTFATADCPTLTLALRNDIAQLKALDDNEQRERTAAPTTLFRAAKRISGAEGAGDLSPEYFKKTREHAAALNDKLAQTGCVVFDIDSELLRAEVKPWEPPAQ